MLPVPLCWELFAIGGWKLPDYFKSHSKKIFFNAGCTHKEEGAVGEAGITVIKAAMSITIAAASTKGEKNLFTMDCSPSILQGWEECFSWHHFIFSEVPGNDYEICQDLLPEPKRTVLFCTSNLGEGFEVAYWSQRQGMWSLSLGREKHRELFL